MADLATQYPTTIGFESVNFTTVTPMLVSETNSGKLRRAGFGHSYYTWEVAYPSLTYTQARSILGYLAQAAGQLYSFEIVLPLLSTSSASSPTSTLNHGSASAGARSVSVTGTNSAQVLKAGDYFKFSGHTKVYQATADLTLSAGGSGTLNFSGGLVQAITSGTVVRNGFAFTACLTEDAQEYSSGPGGITRLSIQMREVWGT